MAFQLVVIGGARGNTPVVLIGAGVTTVGRQDDCQFRIASSQVSRKHCQLYESQGQLVIKDLGSSNGTIVNGKKVSDQQILAPGDELRIGPVKFRIEKLDGPRVAGPPADTAIPEAVAVVGDAVPVEQAEAVAIAADDVFDLNEEKTAPLASPGAPKAGSTAEQGASPEISEDAVAEFLLNIELDEEDKR
jgi:predicted component of type VI protein secretion system